MGGARTAILGHWESVVRVLQSSCMRRMIVNNVRVVSAVYNLSIPVMMSWAADSATVKRDDGFVSFYSLGLAC